MTIHNNDGFMKACATAIGGKGLFLALALAGAGFQGCTTEDQAAGPAGTESAAAPVLEDKTGADLNADGSPVNPMTSAAEGSAIALGKIAPGCVELETLKQGSRNYALVRNWCSTQQRLRIIWRWAADGECVTVWPKSRNGNTYEESRYRPAYVTEVRGC